MTHDELMHKLGRGEMAFQVAYLQLENEQYEQARIDAERNAKSK